MISTHSPYLPAVSSLDEVRVLKKIGDEVHVSFLPANLSIEEEKRLRREIVRFRGEMFFSKALILFEGATEESLVPAMFELCHNSTVFEMGVNCIGVGGKNYRPFLIFAFSCGIPVCIISDNDDRTEEQVNRQIERIKEESWFDPTRMPFSLVFLGKGNDIESELLDMPQLRGEIIKALVTMEAGDDENHAKAKKNELDNMEEEELLDYLRKKKPTYADFLSDIILGKPNGREMIPSTFIEAFDWIASQIRK